MNDLLLLVPHTVRLVLPVPEVAHGPHVEIEARTRLLASLTQFGLSPVGEVEITWSRFDPDPPHSTRQGVRWVVASALAESW